MATPLRQHQWELVDPTNESSVLLFGTEETGYLTTTRPLLSDASLRSNDVDRVGEDGIMFGRDTYAGKSLNFDIGILTDAVTGFADIIGPERANVDFQDALERAWRDKRWRRTALSYAVLRKGTRNGVWRCYGRPRPLDVAEGVLTAQGYTPANGGFDLMDSTWYSDTLQTASIRLYVSPATSILFPLSFPMTTTPIAETTDGTMTVGGTRETPAVVTFHGPVTNPQIKVVGDDGTLTIGLTGTIPDGQSVRYDPRPWVRSITRVSDGASMAGLVSGRTPRMSEANLTPGAKAVSYSGIDATGTSFADIEWRDARARA